MEYKEGQRRSRMNEFEPMPPLPPPPPLQLLDPGRAPYQREFIDTNPSFASWGPSPTQQSTQAFDELHVDPFDQGAQDRDYQDHISPRLSSFEQSPRDSSFDDISVFGGQKNQFNFHPNYERRTCEYQQAQVPNAAPQNQYHNPWPSTSNCDSKAQQVYHFKQPFNGNEGNTNHKPCSDPPNRFGTSDSAGTIENPARGSRGSTPPRHGIHIQPSISGDMYVRGGAVYHGPSYNNSHGQTYHTQYNTGHYNSHGGAPPPPSVHSHHQHQTHYQPPHTTYSTVAPTYSAPPQASVPVHAIAPSPSFGNPYYQGGSPSSRSLHHQGGSPSTSRSHFSSSHSAYSGSMQPPVHPGQNINPSFSPAGCTCKKSKCLKLYCQCFAASKLCNMASCKCTSCVNQDYENPERMKAVRIILERKPHAFDGRVMTKPGYDPAQLYHLGSYSDNQSAYRRSGSFDSDRPSSHYGAVTKDLTGHQNGHSSFYSAARMNTDPAQSRHIAVDGAVQADNPNVYHNKYGCKCRKSACLKKYCECFNGGSKCGYNCRCVNCKNQPSLSMHQAQRFPPYAPHGYPAYHRETAARMGIPSRSEITSAERGAPPTVHVPDIPPVSSDMTCNTAEDTTPVKKEPHVENSGATPLAVEEQSIEHRDDDSVDSESKDSQNCSFDYEDKENKSKIPRSHSKTKNLKDKRYKSLHSDKANSDSFKPIRTTTDSRENKSVNDNATDTGKRNSVEKEAAAKGEKSSGKEKGDGYTMLAALAMTELLTAKVSPSSKPVTTKLDPLADKGKCNKDENCGKERDAESTNKIKRKDVPHSTCATTDTENDEEHKKYKEWKGTANVARTSVKRKRSFDSNESSNESIDSRPDLRLRGPVISDSWSLPESKRSRCNSASSMSINDKQNEKRLNRKPTKDDDDDQYSDHECATPRFGSKTNQRKPHMRFAPMCCSVCGNHRGPLYQASSSNTDQTPKMLCSRCIVNMEENAARDSEHDRERSYNRTPSSETESLASTLPNGLSFRKICSNCGKTRSEHGELGFGNKCVYQDCGRCGAGVQVHLKNKMPMGFTCKLTVKEGAKPGANEIYEEKIKALANEAELRRTLRENAA